MIWYICVTSSTYFHLATNILSIRVQDKTLTTDSLFSNKVRNIKWHIIENSKKSLRWNYSENYLWQITYELKVLKPYLTWPNLTPNYPSVRSLITLHFQGPPQSVLSSPNTPAARLQALGVWKPKVKKCSFDKVINHLFSINFNGFRQSDFLRSECFPWWWMVLPNIVW